MLKEVFTDGLIQIAIIISLLRTDLYQQDTFNLQDQEEFLQGPTGAYTQTRFHHHNWNQGRRAFIHPKHIDNTINEQLLHELHALGRYGDQHAQNTLIEAMYLVSNPAPLPTAGNAANGNDDSDNNNNEHQQSNGNGTATEPQEGTNTGQEEPEPKEQPRKEEVHFGAELTKEDMDLIEVLWKQDIDLGAEREQFDANLRQEREKQRELELHKQQQEEFEKEKQQQQQQQQLPEQPNNVTYIQDSETGELIPVPLENNVTQQNNVQQIQPPNQQQPLQQNLAPFQNPDLDDALQYALQYVTQEQQSFHQQQQNFDQQQQQQQIFELQQQQQQQQQIFELQQQQQQQQQQQEIFQHQQQNFEQQPAQEQMNNLEHHDSWEAFAHATILRNVTLPGPLPNGTDFNINPQPITVTPNDTSFIPFNPLSIDIANNTFLDDMDIESLLMNPGNETAAAATPPNGTESGLHNLFDLDLNSYDPMSDFAAMDLNNADEGAIGAMLMKQETEEKIEDMSDSAVGSMTASSAGSRTPNEMSDSMSNVSSSRYNSIGEGATGGRDVSDFSSVLKTEIPDNFTYHGHSAANLYDDHDMNSEMNNSSSNESFPEYTPTPKYEANPRHVAHNHSYPLAPGQAPRERKLTLEEKRASAQMSRDEKKAKNMKIPFGIDDIIHSPVDEYNDMLMRYKLSEPQLQLIKDIRRRGKNKVAAQNCRKRKMEIISSLEEEVNSIREQRNRLQREKAKIDKSLKETKDKYSQMYEEIFQSLRDENGRPYDPAQFTLQQSTDGNVFLVPVNSTVPQGDHNDKSIHKRKGKKHSR